MDVLSLLKKDHRSVEGMLDKAMKCEPEDNTLHDLAAQIEEALIVHATIEEKFFYPLLRKRAEETEDTVDVFEAYTEHDLLKRLIALLQSGRQPDEKFKAEVQVLTESVKHHVKEEESTIFSLARKVMAKDELDELGQKMEKAKQRLTAAAAPLARARKATAPTRARKTARR
jgi:hemerythrin superfamily protein